MIVSPSMLPTAGTVAGNVTSPQLGCAQIVVPPKNDGGFPGSTRAPRYTVR